MKLKLNELQVTILTMIVTIVGGLALRHWTEQNDQDPGVTTAEGPDTRK